MKFDNLYMQELRMATELPSLSALEPLAVQQLLETADGDTEFLQEVFNTFIESVADLRPVMDQALRAGDMATLHRAAPFSPGREMGSGLHRVGAVGARNVPRRASSLRSREPWARRARGRTTGKGECARCLPRRCPHARTARDSRSPT